MGASPAPDSRQGPSSHAELRPGEAIFHIALASDWIAARAVGDYRVSTLGSTLEQVRFIHASRADQVSGVLGTFYRAVSEPLILLRIAPERLGVPVMLEPAVAGSEPESPGSELFPHVYGPISVSSVVEEIPLQHRADGSWELPDL